ncbi:hypothetical protein [Nocardia thailandica]
MIALGFAVAIGLPLLVLFAAIVWPEPIAPANDQGNAGTADTPCGAQRTGQACRRRTIWYEQ